jgi:hypothetical protein
MSDKGCLNIAVDLPQWKRMTEEERQEQVFFCLRYLTQQAQERSTMRMLATFGAHLFGSLIVLVPTIFAILHYFAGKPTP